MPVRLQTLPPSFRRRLRNKHLILLLHDAACRPLLARKNQPRFHRHTGPTAAPPPGRRSYELAPKNLPCHFSLAHKLSSLPYAGLDSSMLPGLGSRC
eukprot:365663-Chlamydomonas_euryale.AAC.6